MFMIQLLPQKIWLRDDDRKKIWTIYYASLFVRFNWGDLSSLMYYSTIPDPDDFAELSACNLILYTVFQ